MTNWWSSKKKERGGGKQNCRYLLSPLFVCLFLVFNTHLFHYQNPFLINHPSTNYSLVPSWSGTRPQWSPGFANKKEEGGDIHCSLNDLRGRKMKISPATFRQILHLLVFFFSPMIGFLESTVLWLVSQSLTSWWEWVIKNHMWRFPFLYISCSTTYTWNEQNFLESSFFCYLISKPETDKLQ